MSKKYMFDFVGYAPEYGSTPVIAADSIEHGEFKAHEYIKDFYPELQEVEIVETREVN